ncbi:iron ABC transporter permease [Flaviflexus ciconiae]|uniref:Iron ABC transporter permease n=1 Tax=Flaviflexus ciconiae TaxID=2496867 RepID=A0A3S9PXD1_9ACTO|nr:iron ABC transporter permease [Flaviflexus ciconiae]AZQ76988.1 iron ABC transporter permease [Flaviflexus ciconiae]
MTVTQAVPTPRTERSRGGRRLAFITLLLVLLALAVLASIMFGVRSIGVSDAFAAIQGNTDTAEQAAAYKRIPRTALGFLIGAALAMSGTSMQAVTRNPLADPGIFGVLSGASLAVVIGMTFFGATNPVNIMFLAILGSAFAAAFVYVVGSLGRGGATPLKLALAGAATSAALTALVSAILLPRIDVMDSFRHWQIGGVAGAEWDRLGIAIPFLIVGTLICVFTAGGLNALALGDELATGLGENVLRTRILSSIGAVILCGVATALAGPIGFVGLIVPHLCRLIVGTDHRWLMPTTALAGAVLVILADTLGRVVVPGQEIAVGIIMPIIGAPFFIWIVRRQKVREL